VVTAGALYDGGESATVEIFGRSYETTVAGVFVVGAVTALVFMIGVWALMAGMGRSRRKRVERKEAKARQRDSVKSLEEERAELRAENERLSEQLASDRKTSDHTTTGHPVAAASDGTSGTEGTTQSYGLTDTPGTAHTGGHGDTTADDRVVDHRSDLTASDTSGAHRTRDTI
jgi:hypothetical protein